MQHPSDEQNSAASQPAPDGKKGRPTPTRKEREAQNRRPLVPDDRKLARQQERERLRQERERARLGMLAGDEKYLMDRDRGAQRKYIRDYVDARYSVGELLIPVMIVVLIASFFQQLAAISVFVLWGYFLLLVVDSITLSLMLRRRIKAKFGAENVQKGNWWYASMRAMQLRRMRAPQAQVGRGEYPA